MRKKFLFFLLLPLFIYLLFFPGKALSASIRGVDLWFHTVLPALLPFIILSGILVKSGIILPALRKADGIFRYFPGLSGAGTYALVLGIFCGFPMGAKITASLLSEKSISYREAEFLLCVSNHVSPVFLRSYVASILPDPRLARAVTGIYYASAAVLYCLCRSTWKQTPAAANVRKKEASSSVGELLDTSIMEGFDAMLRLGGYIILFTVYAELVKTFSADVPLLSPILSMILEISSGTEGLLHTPLALPVQVSILLAGLSFGGISTAAQTAGMIRGTGLSVSRYLKAKLLQAVIACAFTLLFFAVV